MVHVKIKDLGIKFNLDKKRDKTIKNLLLNPLKQDKSREFWAIRRVDLELKPGDVLGITGPNGSGKSTLLRAITGIYSPDEGSLDVNGKVSLLAIGAGFQQELTGIENIYLNGAVFGMTEKEINKRLKKIVSFADIGKFIYQPVRTYSSGMSARLGFAIAINLDPDILLIDEVMAVGDKEFKEKCNAEIERLLALKRKIVIIVSHNPELLNKLCAKQLFMDALTKSTAK